MPNFIVINIVDETSKLALDAIVDQTEPIIKVLKLELAGSEERSSQEIVLTPELIEEIPSQTTPPSLRRVLYHQMGPCLPYKERHLVSR